MLPERSIFCDLRRITGDTSGCHAFVDHASFWRLLTDIDHQTAGEVQAIGCPCGAHLHSARYPRKPRGVPRTLFGEEYVTRLSFCCNRHACRRRCTPFSVRYPGRRVYLGVMVTLATAKECGQKLAHRQRLLEQLRMAPKHTCAGSLGHASDCRGHKCGQDSEASVHLSY